MKELSIKQKAQRYDEALEKSKRLYEQGTITESLCYVFPELKESEDERIRKAIHIYLDWLDGHKDCQPKGEYSIRDMLTWLEKQGESYTKRDVDDAYIEGMAFAKNELEKQAEVVSDKDDIEAEEKGIRKAFNKIWEEKQDKQKSQRMISAEAKEAMYDKPACAWSEEDKEMCQETIDWFEKKCFPYALENDNPARESIKWLKSLKNRVIPQSKQEWSEKDEERIKNILSVLDVQVCWNGATGKKENPYQKEINWLKFLKDRAQPQPKQEWSEDDDDDAWMNDIISKVENNLQLNKAEIDFLKSLKYRYTWKPSDKQMADLWNMLCECRPADHQLLQDIYYGLKKLREDKVWGK